MSPDAPTPVSEFELLQQILFHIRAILRLTAHLAAWVQPINEWSNLVDFVTGPTTTLRRDIYRATHNALHTVYQEILSPYFWSTARIGGIDVPPVPTLRTCRVCGCSDQDACLSHCSWHSEDLCSVCVQFIHIPAELPHPLDTYPDPFAVPERL